MPTKIEWTDETWNPFVGCRKVSAGCLNCYAEAMASERLAVIPATAGVYGEVVDRFARVWSGRVSRNGARMELPNRWDKPRRIFVCSMGDPFYREVPRHWIYNVLDITQETTARYRQTGRCGHIYQFLTKRAIRMEMTVTDWNKERANGADFSHIRMGVTVESQEQMHRVFPLRRTPAGGRFLSLEPLLGPIQLGDALKAVPDSDLYGDLEVCGKTCPPVDQVIIGCESGPNRRKCELSWVEALVEECTAAGVSVFVKQLSIGGRVSKNPAEWPEHLRRQEFPAADLRVWS